MPPCPCVRAVAKIKPTKTVTAQRLAVVMNLIFTVLRIDCGCLSRLKEAKETASGLWAHRDESVRAVVLNRAGDVAPINRTQTVGVLLKRETGRDRWPGNGH